MSGENKSAVAQNGLEPKPDDNSDIDFILNDIGGPYNKFQLFNYASYMFSLCFCGIVIMTYVFSALNLEYRYIAHDIRILKMSNKNIIGNISRIASFLLSSRPLRIKSNA